MKWQAAEMDTYLKSKEYVDTALISLIPISWEKDVKSTVSMGEFITIISTEIEKQFQGRVIEFPPFTYLKTEENNSKVDRLKKFGERELLRGGIKHIIFLTSDSEWKMLEQDLGGMLMWLPSIPLEHMELQYKRDVISDQIKQIIPILINKWQVG